MRICIPLLLLYFFTGCSKKDAALLPATPDPGTPVSSVTSRLYPFANTAINSNVNGFYVALPSDYQQTQKRHPLLLFIPGGGQFGNGSIDLPLLLRDGPVQLVDEGRFPGTFTVGGAQYSFIILTPQFRAYPSPTEIRQCIDYARSKYRVDSSRIYLSGLSIGGIEITNLAAQMPERIAAIVPLAGVPQDFNSNNKCQQIAAANLPVWAFHSENDPVFNISWPQAFVAKINMYQPAIPARLTRWPNGGHDAWTRALEPLYRENGKNIYEWMLQYHR